jgi:hypothetical protein
VGVQFSSMSAIEIFDSRDKRCAGISVRRAESPVRVGGALTKYRKRRAGSIGRR